MKILVVEDQQEAREDLVDELVLEVPAAELDFAASRDSALELLESSGYDLIVCDLRIPATDGSLDAQEVHGLAVHARAREICAGVPLIFFTGRGTIQNTAHALSTGGTANLFGVGEEALVTIYEKDHMLDFVARVAEMQRRYVELDDLVISGVDGLAPEFAEMVVRALRIYGRTKGAVRTEVHLLTGLSGSVVGRAVLSNLGGAVVASVFFKVGERRKIDAEKRRYSDFVRGTLSHRAFAPDAGSVLHNLRSRGAIFYHIADGYRESLFDLLARAPEEAPRVLSSIQRALDPWHLNQLVEETVVGELRRLEISDEKCLERGVNLEFGKAFEAVRVPLARSIQHGDLHAGNVLVDKDLGGLLIDFGDVGWGPRVLDPVMLEFGLLFHPDSPLKGTGWPTLEQAEQWWDLDAYLVGCPAAKFVAACRSWELELDEEGLAAVVYANACRQLKYDDVDPDLALGVARGAVAFGTSARPARAG